MQSYNHLTQEERYYISALKANDLSTRQIAEQLNPSISCILQDFS